MNIFSVDILFYPSKGDRFFRKKNFSYVRNIPVSTAAITAMDTGFDFYLFLKFHLELSEEKSYSARVGVLSATE